MDIRLTRFAYSPFGTLGRLDLDGDILWTVERQWENNRPNVSCIPEGVYRCKRYNSAKYPDHWEVTGVPGRTKILIHSANWPGELAGCIAPGLNLGRDHSVQQSRSALRRFMEFTRGLDEFDLHVTHYVPEYP